MSVDAMALLTEEVRELVRRGAVDPAVEPEAVRSLVAAAVAEYEDRSLTSGLSPLLDRRGTAGAVWDAVAGFGPLQRHLDDPDVEEIWVNDRLTGAYPWRARCGHGLSDVTTWAVGGRCSDAALGRPPLVRAAASK